MKQNRDDQPRLSKSQTVTLLELAEPNENPEGEWRLSGRGPLASAGKLVALGLAKQHRYHGFNGRVFSLTDTGRALARKLGAHD